MKKKIILSLIILLIVLVTVVYAADVKWSALAELTTIADDDVLCVIDTGAGASKKITVLNFFDTIDTFAELNTITADKTLVNEEDAATWDALGTFGLGITITTGDPFTLGANRIDNGSDLLDGEMIADDTIDDDSIDLADFTGADITLTDCGAIISTGTITATIGFDIVGAADIDYGSIDVTDHTFVTDGTGDGEIVLPNDSIGDAEIDWSGLTTSADFTVTGTLIASVGIDTVGAADMDYGSVDVTDHTFVTDGTGDGEIVLPNDSIGDAEINWAGLTDLAAGGVLSGDCVDESHIDDDGIDSEHYNDGSIDLVHIAAAAYAKDIVTTSPVTGGTDNVLVGADGDVTIAVTIAKDIVTTAPLTGAVDNVIIGTDADITLGIDVLKDIVTTAPITGGEDDVLPGADADLTIALTLAKDLVTTAPVTGGTDNILPGADADITIALDFTTDWNFSGADLELPQASPGVPDADGEIEVDFTDGTVVIQHGSAHAELGAATDVVVGKLIKSWSATIFEPDGVNDVLTVKAINSIEFPHGVVITAIYLGIASDTNYVLTVQNFDDFDTINGANGTIDTVTYTADTTGEIIDTTPTYATIAAGQIIMVSIPSTDVDWIHFEIYYYEPAA